MLTNVRSGICSADAVTTDIETIVKTDSCVTPLRLHRLLIVASIIVPAALFGIAALQSRSDVLREGKETVIRTTAVLHEHARKVFETEELVFARVEDRIRELTWVQIASPETSQFLEHLQDD
jgi:hypothetical protein